MYARYEGHPVITLGDWRAAGLTMRQYQYDHSNGDLMVAKNSREGNTLIILTSIRRPERRAMIEAKYGPIEEAEPEAQMKAEVDTEARAYYTSYRKGDGSPLEPKLVEQYTNRASLLETLREAGIHVAVNSNKPDDAVKRLCRDHFGDLIECALGERAGVPRKPAPDAALPCRVYPA